MIRSYLLFACLCSLSFSLHAQTPELTAWIYNTTGLTGSHYEVGTYTPFSDDALANVQEVEYSDDNVYVHSTGVPAYPTGPFQDGNPSYASELEYLFRIPRDPEPNTGTLTEPGLGHIGVWINGVPVYNYSDAMSYNGMDIWHRNAVVFENAGFDCSKGHPAPIMGAPGPDIPGMYHHHQNPSPFSAAAAPLSDVCDSYPANGLYIPDAGQHSPLLGYAFDGYPIYGAYAYSNTDGSGGITRMESGWAKRDITQRHTLADGTVLDMAEWGPDVNDSYPLGAYKEDFEFTGGGDLDVHNGRFAVTPEYPEGTYAYYTTIDEDGNSAFPYVIGETYCGIVAADNFPMGPVLTSVVISEPTNVYDPSTAVVLLELPEIMLFPNPATDQVQLQVLGVLHTDQEVLATDLLGNSTLLKVWPAGTTRLAMDVSGLAAGYYQLTIGNNQQQTHRSLMIIR